MGGDVGDEIKMVNQYRVGVILGEGRFGKVKLCQDTETGRQYAMKIYRKGVLARNREFCLKGSAANSSRPQRKVVTGIDKAYREIWVMQHLKTFSSQTDGVRAGEWWEDSSYDDDCIPPLRNHVLGLHEVLDRGDIKFGKFYLVTTLGELGPLMRVTETLENESQSLDNADGEGSGEDDGFLNNPYELPRKICLKPCLASMETYPQSVVKCFIHDVAVALAFCHSPSMRIAHRDVKPTNIYITDSGRAILGDFGAGCQMSSTFAVSGTEGTHHFFPPESCACPASKQSTTLGNQDGRAADIWALGVTLYALLFGCLPFNSNSIAGLFETIASGLCTTPPIPIPLLQHNCEDDTEVLDLLAKLMEANPTKRLTAVQVLEHSWVASAQFDGPDLIEVRSKLQLQVELELEGKT
eukprot:GHVN01068722.1.p1 GENE.GHVN01068722.1~~GHVN01068722.1.p1  ORF type:complete len:411 (-),score=39.21 GHVN01068722.1:2621-3853(-)